MATACPKRWAEHRRLLGDDRNPTGYVQVLDEVSAPQISRAFVYGLEMIEQDAVNTFNLQVHTSFNVYDGHGPGACADESQRRGHRHV